MIQPSLYHKANVLQRCDAEEIMKKYHTKIQWRHDGHDSLIDIGSGCGDVLFDFIYPHLPKNFERIVFSDINLKMLNYAQKLYGSNTKCHFELLNIAMQKDLPATLRGKFDHVTSFYCFNWVQDLRQAFKNIYSLLRPENGDCLLIFAAYIPIYDIYCNMSRYAKWSPYMKDIQRFITPLHYCNDPKQELCNILEDAGFTDYEVRIREKTFIYDSLKVFEDNMKVLNPYMDFIPEQLHQKFMDDFLDAVLGKSHRSLLAIPTFYKQAVVYARKGTKVSK